ncbi:MAG: PAS domain S-box protein [Methanomicrobiales archaeon]|nr:PAS domain S-box protein [Methanomicrobiales archaeon]
MKKCSLLVVEDEALIAANLVHTLSSLGYTVHKPVATGEDAVRAVEGQQPDLVLMDIQLIGEMDGIEAADKIRAIADIPIVYLTAYSDDLRLKQARLTEPYGYIVKPAHNRELHATIEMALYKHGLDRKLKESEERNRSIVEALPGFIFHFSSDGRFIDCPLNKGDLLLLPADQIIGKRVAEILPPDLAHLTERKIRETLDSGQLQIFDYSLTMQDQEHFFEARMITSGTNSVLAFVYEITERKRAEDALLQEKNYSDRLFDASHDTVFLFEPSTGKPIRWNKTFTGVSGYTDDEIAGMNAPFDFYDEADLKKATDALGRNYAGDVAVELSLRTKQGAHIPFEYSATPIETADGRTLILSIGRDLTDRKLAEEKLVAALKRVQGQQAALALISFSPALLMGDVDGFSTGLNEESSAVLGVERASVWLFDNNGDELRCIDLYEASHNRHSGDLILMRDEYENEFDALRTAKYIDAHDPLTDPRTAGYVERYLKPNHITSMLDAVIRVSGQNLGVLCFEHVNRPHTWESDEITFACQLADQVAITLLNRDRKRAEEALRESEEKFRLISESSPDHIIIQDCDLRYIWVLNPQLGLMPGDMIGKTDHDFLSKEDADLLTLVKRQVLMTGKAKPFETSLSSSQGVTEYFEGVYLPKYDTAGRVDGVMGYFRNITGRKEAEEALRESERRLKDIISFLPDATLVIDKNGVVLAWNRAMEEMTGVPAEQMIGKANYEYALPFYHERRPITVDLVLHDDPAVVATYPFMQTEGGSRRSEIFIPYLNKGRGAYIWFVASPLYDADGNLTGAIESIRDITERRQADEAVRQANRKLNLLSSITRHDINNQLLVLNGFLNLLQKKAMDPALEDFFNRITKASSRISAMIQFTKEYEQIGVHAPAWQDCRTLVDTAARQAPLGKVIVQNDLPSGSEVFADPLVVKVFYNLMDNAVRYGEKITTIRFSAMERDDNLVVIYEDDGDGVPADEKEKIFERGFGNNTGLCLALSREILSITGITITETGEPGQGARFGMTVPKGMWRMAGNDT